MALSRRSDCRDAPPFVVRWAVPETGCRGMFCSHQLLSCVPFLLSRSCFVHLSYYADRSYGFSNCARNAGRLTPLPGFSNRVGPEGRRVFMALVNKWRERFLLLQVVTMFQ